MITISQLLLRKYTNNPFFSIHLKQKKKKNPKFSF